LHVSATTRRARGNALTPHPQGNSLLAGLATGAVLAVHTRKLPVVAVSSALSGALMVSVDAAGAAFDHIAGSLMDRVPRD
jgi:hypothetical protein